MAQKEKQILYRFMTSIFPRLRYQYITLEYYIKLTGDKNQEKVCQCNDVGYGYHTPEYNYQWCNCCGLPACEECFKYIVFYW